MIASKPGKAFQLLLTAALFWLVLAGCQNGGEAEVDGSSEESAAPEIPHHLLEELEAVEAVDLREIDAASLRRLRADDAEVFPPCRELFEEDGEFLDWPLSPEEIAPALFGCDPEGYVELDDGSRAVAYAVSMKGQRRATDLQVVFYGGDGSVQWRHRMDRSREAPNFAANYRGSFLTGVDERLVCAGTLWQGGTQAFCARRDSGEVVFDSRLDFWAGLKLFAFAGSLYSVDLRGITRRYPFTGTEMRHRSLPGRGGRAAFYATDERRIFYASAEDDALLSGWDLETMAPIWRAELPDRPRVTYRYTSLEHELLLLKVTDRVYGFDTKTGRLRMVFEVGESHPPIAFSDDTLYLLLRRDGEPPLIYAIAPDDGKIRWVGLAAGGSLEIQYDEGLLVRSVRAVRKVEPLDGSDND